MYLWPMQLWPQVGDFASIGAFLVTAHVVMAHVVMAHAVMATGWRLHREFFASIGGHLSEGGIVVLQENAEGWTHATFEGLLEGTELEFISAVASPFRNIYFFVCWKPPHDPALREQHIAAMPRLHLREPIDAASQLRVLAVREGTS